MLVRFFYSVVLKILKNKKMKAKRKTKKRTRSVVHRTAGLPMVSGHSSRRHHRRGHRMGGIGSGVVDELMNVLYLSAGYVAADILVNKVLTKVDLKYKQIGVVAAGMMVPTFFSKNKIIGKVGLGASVYGVTSLLKDLNVIGSIGEMIEGPVPLIDQVAEPMIQQRDGIRQKIGYGGVSRFQNLAHVDGF